MSFASDVERQVIHFPERSPRADLLAVEEPLEIRIGAAPLAVTMRTPGHDMELAAGFCLTEGIVDSPDDIERVEPCTLANYGNIAVVTLADDVSARVPQVAGAQRAFFISSSCGLCGSQSIDRLERKIPPFGDLFSVPAERLGALPGLMREAQETFSSTGGLHAAALFDSDCQLRLLREDIGRHNAVDKVIGALLLSGQIPAGPSIMLVSGRLSFELVQKAARAGIAFLAAIGAASSLASDAASRFGMTLVGFLRPEGRFNIYHDPGRIRI